MFSLFSLYILVSKFSHENSFKSTDSTPKPPSNHKTQHLLSSRREIPSASFQLHAVHCARNITLCTRCDEPIPRAEFEEHMETVHRQLECDTGCGARMEVGKMEDHKVSTQHHHVDPDI